MMSPVSEEEERSGRRKGRERRRWGTNNKLVNVLIVSFGISMLAVIVCFIAWLCMSMYMMGGGSVY